MDMFLVCACLSASLAGTILLIAALRLKAIRESDLGFED